VPVSVVSGYDPGYLGRGAAGGGAENYHLKSGQTGMEPAGRWTGKGLAALGLEEGQEVDIEVLKGLFTGRDNDGRVELIKPDGTVVRQSQQAHSFTKMDKRLAEEAARRFAELPRDLQTASRQREIEFRVRAELGRERVTFYDVGFTAPKSVSVLQAGYWAKAEAARTAGDTARAERYDAKAQAIEDAFIATCRSIVARAEEHVYLRTGHHSYAGGEPIGEWRDTAGLAAGIFLHHTSRTARGAETGDPHLHGHIAVWAQVMRADQVDDLYRSLDASGLFQMKSFYAAVAELEFEQRLQQLGYAIERTGNGDFEVRGSDPKVICAFSQRAREVTGREAELREAFTQKHGYEPSPAGLRFLHRVAWAETRQPKTDPPDRLAQLEAWKARAEAAARAALAEMPDAAEDAARDAPQYTLTDAERQQHIVSAVATLQRDRSTWTWPHLALEIRKTLPPLPKAVTPEQVTDLAVSMTRDALSGRVPGTDIVMVSHQAVPDLPDLRASGESIYHRPGELTRFSTVARLEDEQKLLEDGRRTLPPLLSLGRAAFRLGTTVAAVDAELARQASDGGAEVQPARLSSSGLTNDQVIAAYEILTSGAAVLPLLGGPGTGKTKVAGIVATIVREETGQRVLGLAAGTNQAEEMRKAGITEVYNLADFHGCLHPDERQKASQELAAKYGPRGPAGRCGNCSDPLGEPRRGHVNMSNTALVFGDEYGQWDMTAIIETMGVTTKHGVRTVPMGDPGQTGSVGAGGGLDLMAARLRSLELHEAKRFDQAWQEEVATRIRAGDVTVARELIDRGHVCDGTRDQVMQRMAHLYAGSILGDRTAVLVTPSNEMAADLSALVRAELIAAGVVADRADGVLADGNSWSAGDLVLCRANDRYIEAGSAPPGASPDPVTEARAARQPRTIRNRDVIKVDTVHAGAAIARRLLEPGPADQQKWSDQFLLPVRYMERHAQLAYGGNTYVSIGKTADDGYEVLPNAPTRETFLVSTTRDRSGTIIGVITDREATEAERREAGIPDPDTPMTVKIKTAESVLASAIANKGNELSATRTMEREQENATSMAVLTSQWQQLVRKSSHEHYDGILRAALPAEAYERLQSDRERTTLMRQLQRAEMTGTDAAAILADAVGNRDFTGARSIAAVLNHRVGKLAGNTDKPMGTYVRATPAYAHPKALELAQLADQQKVSLGERAAAEKPVWALRYLGDVPEDPAARADWTAKAGTIAARREQTGFRHPLIALPAAPEKGAVEQRALHRAAVEAAGIEPDHQEIKDTDDILLGAELRDYERLMQRAPQDVTAQLARTKMARDDLTADARIGFKAAELADATAQADRLRQEAAVAAVRAQELADKEQWLRIQDEEHRDFEDATERQRERAAVIRAELEERHPPEAAEASGQLQLTTDGRAVPVEELPEPEREQPETHQERQDGRHTGHQEEQKQQQARGTQHETTRDSTHLENAGQEKLPFEIPPATASVAAEVRRREEAAESLERDRALAAHWTRVADHRERAVVRPQQGSDSQPPEPEKAWTAPQPDHKQTGHEQAGPEQTGPDLSPEPGSGPDQGWDPGRDEGLEPEM